MPLSRRVARFNRAVANHFVGPVLTRMPGFGTVHHRGRRSGRPYRTPVRVFARGDEYIILLPYGPGADWVKNVLAADGCVLTMRGADIPVGRPRLAEDDGGLPVPALVRRILSRVEATTYLVLAPVPPRPGDAVSSRVWKNL